MPVNIAGTTNIQQKFIQSLMATSNSLALSQLWLVKIDKDYLEIVGEYLKSAIQTYEGSKWDINDVTRTTDTQWFVGDALYILAQSVVFPGDSISVSRAGVSQSGMLKGIMGESRNDLPAVTITFLETNQSAVDILFRPWMILVGHKSLKNQELRTNIDLICYQKNGVQSDLVPRKIVTLYAAAPINVPNEEYNYTGDKVIVRSIDFTYNTYSIEADIGINTTSDSAEYIKLSNDREQDGGLVVEPKKDPTANTDLNLPPDFDVPLQPVETAQTALDRVAEGLRGGRILPDDVQGQSKKESTSLFGSIKNLAQGVNQSFNNVTGKLNTGEGLLTQALRSLPGGIGEAEANKVDQFSNNITNKITKPVANVITTGNVLLRGAESVVQLNELLTTPINQPIGIIHTIKTYNKV